MNTISYGVPSKSLVKRVTCWEQYMKIKNKKANISIFGKKEEGYIVKLPPNQVPSDFYMSASELYALYLLLKSYYEKK